MRQLYITAVAAIVSLGLLYLAFEVTCIALDAIYGVGRETFHVLVKVI